MLGVLCGISLVKAQVSSKKIYPLTFESALAINNDRTLTNPGSIFGTLKGLSPDFGSQKTRTLGLTRDPPESQFPIVNTDNVD